METSTQWIRREKTVLGGPPPGVVLKPLLAWGRGDNFLKKLFTGKFVKNTNKINERTVKKIIVTRILASGYLPQKKNINRYMYLKALEMSSLIWA